MPKTYKTLSSLFVSALVAAFLIAPGAQSSVAADPINYKIDTVHSAIIFKVKHKQVAYSYGRFNDFSGTITADPEDVTGAQIDITVQAASIDTANNGRDEHLRGGDFFNVRQFPTLSFKSTSVKKTDDGYKLKGEMTVKGVTKPVEADLDYVGSATSNDGTNMIGAEARFTIKRTDFGMNYMVGPLGDEIMVTVSIEASDKK